jgi:hypothetical protein
MAVPNKTAIRRAFTRRISLPTLAVLRSKASRSALLGLLVLTVSGCGDNAPTPLAPTPLAPTPAPAPAATIRVEGRVLDEQNQPVQGARVTLLSPTPVGPVPSTTADNAGGFSLTVDWQAHWLEITLGVDREGFEAAWESVSSADATREVLITMYRALTISPGKSIHITAPSVSAAGGGGSRFLCGESDWDASFCRPVLVNAPSGESVDLEVFPADGQTEVGLLRARFGSLRRRAKL